MIFENEKDDYTKRHYISEIQLSHNVRWLAVFIENVARHLTAQLAWDNTPHLLVAPV